MIQSAYSTSCLSDLVTEVQEVRRARRDPELPELVRHLAPVIGRVVETEVMRSRRQAANGCRIRRW